MSEEFLTVKITIAEFITSSVKTSILSIYFANKVIHEFCYMVMMLL